ncbi:MAG: queuosine precursor transporter [Helicobacter sp.]|nr:queuosine precursor transporter [Helicobacteraceae bacterium]MDY3113324.1 queuosine precursor transporter [Helicobacter sp.]
MAKSVMIFSIILFSFLIIASNILVQYPINSFLTFGALTYPFTFLLSDILAEKYSKKEVLKVVRIGILCAFIPSMFLAEFQIALASICAFFIAQQIDVYAFYFLKSKFPRIWWLRSAGSTAFSQFVDTLLFFSIAFAFILPWQNVLLLALGDYLMKFIFAFTNTPFFYIFAFKFERFLKGSYEKA